MGRSSCGHPQGAGRSLSGGKLPLYGRGSLLQGRSLSGLRTVRGDVLLESVPHLVWSLGQGSSSLGGASPPS